MRYGQKTLSKIEKVDEICPLAVPKEISTNQCTHQVLEKIHRYLLKLSNRNENTDVSRADKFAS